MASNRMVGLLLGLCTGAGCSSTDGDDPDAKTESTTTGTSTGQTANTNAVTQAASTSASGTLTTSSSATTASGNGNGGAGTEGSSTAAGDTTGVGGAAGNADATSETTTTAAGGSGGEAGACPNQPPSPDSSCSSLGVLCAYEDCAGAGRTVASCVNGAWSVTTSACGETVDCTAGGAQCSEGEICLVRAGGALLQDCVPNTCETGPVECDCIEGCSGECATYGTPESGITITCNTCPNGMLCP